MERFAFATYYITIIPYAIAAFIGVLILTPLIGKLGERLGVIDLPANLRKRGDRTKEQRLHTKPKVRLGGLAVMIIFIAVVLLSGRLNTQLIGIIIGNIILIVAGYIDDRYELSPKFQLLFQVIAAAIVVIAGTSIKEVRFSGINLNFATSVTPIEILGYIYNFTFPADILTIFWIVTMINALNWMCGIDALGEMVSIIASLTLGILAMKYGFHEITAISFILAASIAGFLPYNFPPSRILGGTIGEANYGLILASLAIFPGDQPSGAKFGIALIILILPLADMFYVLIRRMIIYKTINPFKLLSISGAIHLHHRLLNMGLSVKKTLFIEVAIFSAFALTTFLISEDKFRLDFLIIISVIVAVMICFAIGAFVQNRIQFFKSRQPKAKVGKIIENETPEEKYKY